MARSIQKILAQFPGADRLATAPGNDLTARVAAKLPVGAVDQLTGAVINGDTLVLTVANPAWCARLRYMSNELLADLGPQGPKHVSVRVARPPSAPPAPAAPPRRTLSHSAAATIRAQAAATDDPKLQSILERLASRADTRSRK